MGRMAATPKPASDRGNQMNGKTRYVGVLISLALLCGVAFISHSAQSQSGRQKNTNAKPSASPASTRPRQAVNKLPPPPMMPTPAATATEDKPVQSSDDVVRVSSHLVPVPTTVLDARGAALPNLKVEDFELVVDGELKTISDIYRAETPVRLAMLFDNS